MKQNDQKMAQLMTGLGFAERHSGTALVRCAAAVAAKRPGARTFKEIYPAVAREAGITPYQVERNMRHAILSAYNAAPEQWRSFCGPRRPTNSEVIVRLVGACFAD